MALRDKMLDLVDELWAEAEQATIHRSRVESRILREAANRVLAVMDLPERAWSPPPEEPPSYTAVPVDDMVES